MKKSLFTIFIIGLMAASCGSAELEAENSELKLKVAQLEKDLKAATYEAEEQTKLAKFSQEEATTALARAEEILKNCKK